MSAIKHEVGRVFRVTAGTGDRVLTEGVIDKNARYLFTHGACQNLAVAVHERTGWPLIEVDHDAVLDRLAQEVAQGRLSKRQLRRHVGHSRHYHTGVLTPDGLVLDIDGLHERQAWVDRWGLPGAKVTVFDGFVELADWYLADMDKCHARSFVDAVLELAVAA